MVNNKLKNKIWKFAQKQMSKYDIKDSKYITELCSGPGYMKNKYPKEIFEKAVNNVLKCVIIVSVQNMFREKSLVL